jgi:hypothetical protein
MDKEVLILKIMKDEKCDWAEAEEKVKEMRNLDEFF